LLQAGNFILELVIALPVANEMRIERIELMLMMKQILQMIVVILIIEFG
jgi:hypothetical protein